MSTATATAPPSPAILETALYAENLEAAESFYAGVMGLEVVLRQPGRHVFFRVAGGMLLVFRPSATAAQDDSSVCGHGAIGPGHVCFAATAEEIDRWVEVMRTHRIPIEADVHWPNGARSVYVRDPAGNCVEFAESRLWAPAG